jgi:hypothetical protein
MDMAPLTRESWPPVEHALPSTFEAIEAGRIEQQGLFQEPPDDSRAGRLARILGSVPGVMTADRLEETQ